MRRVHGPAPPSQGGVSLIVVLLLLAVVAVAGVGATQIAMMGERGARNERDLQSALQSAEAGLMDAVRDIDGPPGASSRAGAFATDSVVDFADGCGTGPRGRGLCNPAIAGRPVWQTVDFTDTTRTAGFGDFTGRVFASGADSERGVRPALAPRYVVEAVDDHELWSDLSMPPAKAYRVTAMGFGPRRDIQAVLQMLYRKRKD